MALVKLVAERIRCDKRLASFAPVIFNCLSEAYATRVSKTTAASNTACRWIGSKPLMKRWWHHVLIGMPLTSRSRYLLLLLKLARHAPSPSSTSSAG